MPKGILSIIKDEAKGFLCLPCERLNLDADRFSEYRDSDDHPAEALFENPPLGAAQRPVPEVPPSVPSILRYFLDGSRRTYKVADLILGGRYLPLIAGQVAVAVLERGVDGRHVRPMREFCRFESVMAFPDMVAADDLSYLQECISRQGGRRFRLLTYSVKEGRDFVDLGIAKIMSEMHDLEISAVLHMADRCLLSTERMLVIDGPLRFKKRFDMVQFHNVIGLSKSFRPSFAVGKAGKRMDVGTMAARLSFGERTSAFKTIDDEKTIGMWYLRIRLPQMMTNPLQGIVKAECYAVGPAEQEDGLDAGRVDVISGHILRERNVTPFQTDWRWANHIYPVYLTEMYAKASFASDVSFQGMF